MPLQECFFAFVQIVHQFAKAIVQPRTGPPSVLQLACCV